MKFHYDENGTVTGNYTVFTDLKYTNKDGSYCSGNSENFTADTNVLCLPREDCEELCSALGEACHSLDMQATLPRCYLNTPACDVLGARRCRCGRRATSSTG